MSRSTAPALLIPQILLWFAMTASTASAQPAKGAERLQDSVSPAPASPLIRPPTISGEPPLLNIRRGRHLGWDESLLLDNGVVEVLTVPAVGRILQFGFVNDQSVFWSDPDLHGIPTDPASQEWLNFGGDKTWPAPQSDWPRITPRAWPPPIAFDALPVEASFRRDTVVLRSPVDPHYGIRTERVIRLVADAPVMTVTTTYEKVEGNPVEVGVWVITQLIDPVAVFAPLAQPSRFAEGFDRQSGDALPAQLTLTNGLLSLVRDPARATKIGLDTDRLLWVGDRHALLIQSTLTPGATYPDNGSSAEIYTNPDPKTYVELELLGPLTRLAPGDRVSETLTYTLHRRRSPDPTVDARRILGLDAGR